MLFSIRSIGLALLSMGLLYACQPSRMVYYNFASIKDYKIFKERTIEKGRVTFHFPKPVYPHIPEKITLDTADVVPFEDYITQDGTVAFLIIQNDSIQYEKYFQGYDRSSIVPSFSMAKSITSMLIGLAIADQYINSVHDPVSQYIPDIKHKELAQTTILDLLQMTASLKFDENYKNPFGHIAGFYYGQNLRKRSKRLRIEKSPDYQFEYKSGNAQLLGLILDRALPEEITLSHYLQEKIWKPLEMEFPASWSIDDEKEHPIERTFCCINARAIDFAKLGRLYLNEGVFKNQRIISKDWIAQSTKVDTSNGSAWNYQYQWWLPTQKGDFMAVGLLGQYLYVNPNKNLIIVRLGKKKKKIDWDNLFPRIADAY